MNTWELETKTKKIDTLLRIVSHDIANPLTVIHGMSEAALMFHKPEKKLENILVKVLHASGDIKEILHSVKTIQ